MSESGGSADDWGGFDLFNPTPEHALLRDVLRQFVREEVEPQALEHDRAERFNRGLFDQCAQLGLLGLTVPAEDGGAGMDAIGAAIVHEELSVADPGFCLAYLAHAVLFVNNLTRNASDAQRQRYLSKVISGEWVGGMGMTEPEGGTDVLGMRTTARREDDRYSITGRKMWITNGALDDDTLGDVFLIYAKTDGGTLSTFIVEKGFPGFSLGQKIKDKLGCRASTTAELVFDECVVPTENLVGEEGSSVRHMMRNLELERVTLAAMSLGIGMRCLREMVRWADQRVAFGRPIRDFGQIQRHIADSYAQWRACRSYVYDVARRMDLNKAGNRVDSDGVKLIASTMAKEVADRAIQVLGGYGYVGEGVVERLWRDAKLLEIGGGTLEAHQKNITRDLTRSADVSPALITAARSDTVGYSLRPASPGGARRPNASLKVHGGLVNDVVQALSAWRGGTIGEGDLWRRLLGYDDWYVAGRPGSDLLSFSQFTLARANLIPDPAGGSRLAIFSDADAVEAFTGLEYGTEGLGFFFPSGWEIFSADLDGITSALIDPGSPHALEIPATSFAALKELADAMEVEEAWQRLRRGDEEPEDLGLVARYPRYQMVAIVSEAGYVRITVPHDDGGQFLPIFTHRYALALGMAEISLIFPNETLKTVEVSGERLFPALVPEDVDGIVFDYLGPGEPAAFKMAVLELLLEELARPDDQSEEAPAEDATPVPQADTDASAADDAAPVVRALLAYKAGELSEEELFRAILDHDTWYVPVTEASHALLWDLGGTTYFVAMHAEAGPYDEPLQHMPMGARHLLNQLPTDAQGIAFDLGLPQALGLETDEGAGMLDTLREQANAQDVEALFTDRAQGDASLLLDHEWLFLARDGVPSAEEYGGLRTICLFTAGPALRYLLDAEPQFADADVKRASGHELFAHLAERTDFDAVWINPGRRPVWEPFGPAVSYDLLAGHDPRPEARILPARTIAEIHNFLDLEGVSREGRQHQLEYAGDELVARYTGEIGDLGPRTFLFYPVEPTPDTLSFGPGQTQILCAGKLADLLRQQIASLSEIIFWPGQERREYLAEATRWGIELEKLLEPDLEILPRSAVRSAEGARILRERPDIATREWLNRSRRTVEVLANSPQ